jgi:hypothetical protein
MPWHPQRQFVAFVVQVFRIFQQQPAGISVEDIVQESTLLKSNLLILLPN